MRRKQIYWTLFFLCAVALSYTFVLGHDEPAAPKTTASDSQGASLKSNPAAAFAILVESVMRGKDAVELADLPQYHDLFQFLTAPPSGRYMVKQLTF